MRDILLRKRLKNGIFSQKNIWINFHIFYKGNRITY
nr:MAG TPA: hypothetical protein [Bacteriophage sp.]